MTEQLKRPINQDALVKWVQPMPRYLRIDMEETASMLTVLGYDPKANPPRYEELQTFPRLVDVITEPL